MTNVSERDAETAIAGVALQADRRRPGRRSQVSPELIPLLRGQAVPGAEPEHQFGDPDQLGGARGLFVAVGLAIPLWAVIGLAGRFIFG